MNKINITIVIMFLLSGTVYAEDLDLINKLKDVLNTINETNQLKEQGDDNNTNKSDADSSSITGQLTDSKELITESIPNFNFSGFGTNQNNIGDTTSTIRDPFNLSTQAGVQRSGGFNFGSSFLPNNNAAVPQLKLRGVIQPKSKRPEDLLALLEVDRNEVYMVRVGDEISYDPRNPNAAIKVINISRLSVTVQAGSLGNTLIVR